MGQTAVYQFRYPEPSQPADGPTAFHNLAQDVEDTLVGSLGISVDDSFEVDFVGTGTAASHLVANLKGVRVGGNWSVPDGDLIAGVVGGTTPRLLRSLGRYANAEWEAQLWLTTTTDAVISLIKAGVALHHFYVADDGGLSHWFSGVTRPVPFATWAMVGQTVDVNNSSVGNRAFNLPTGRFTVTPAFSMLAQSASYFAYLFAGSASSVTVGMRHYLGTTATADVPFHLHVLQTTPTGAGGSLSAEPSAAPGEAIERDSVCHTPGCGNLDVVIRQAVPTMDTTALCGACGQEITDLTEV